VKAPPGILRPAEVVRGGVGLRRPALLLVLGVVTSGFLDLKLFLLLRPTVEARGGLEEASFLADLEVGGHVTLMLCLLERHHAVCRRLF